MTGFELSGQFQLSLAFLAVIAFWVHQDFVLILHIQHSPELV
jgi:hypothetical protein